MTIKTNRLDRSEDYCFTLSMNYSMHVMQHQRMCIGRTDINKYIELSKYVYLVRLKISSIFVAFILPSSGLVLHD